MFGLISWISTNIYRYRCQISINFNGVDIYSCLQLCICLYIQCISIYKWCTCIGNQVLIYQLKIWTSNYHIYHIYICKQHFPIGVVGSYIIICIVIVIVLIYQLEMNQQLSYLCINKVHVVGSYIIVGIDIYTSWLWANNYHIYM